MIWTIEFQVFCMFLSFHDNETEKRKKKMLFPKFIYDVEKLK